MTKKDKKDELDNSQWRIKSASSVPMQGIDELSRKYQAGRYRLVKDKAIAKQVEEESTKPLKEITMDKTQTIGWAQTITIIVAILIPTMGGFVFLSNKIDANTTAMHGVELSINDLTNKIDGVETTFDNKLNHLAEMMILAHTNGNVTEAELVAIWESVAGESE